MESFYSHLYYINYSAKLYKVYYDSNISTTSRYFYSLFAVSTNTDMSIHDDYSLPDGEEYDMEPEMWNDDQYASSGSSITASVTNRRSKEATQTDTGYFCIKYSQNKRRYRIEGYSSGKTPGAVIRNAVTGIYESDYMNNKTHTVGSTSEDLFFKVVLATDSVGSEPRTLFYESIDQYERHFNTTVKDHIAEKWREKNQLARIEYERTDSIKHIEYIHVN